MSAILTGFLLSSSVFQFAQRAAQIVISVPSVAYCEESEQQLLQKQSCVMIRNSVVLQEIRNLNETNSKAQGAPAPVLQLLWILCHCLLTVLTSTNSPG